MPGIIRVLAGGMMLCSGITIAGTELLATTVTGQNDISVIVNGSTGITVSLL